MEPGSEFKKIDTDIATNEQSSIFENKEKINAYLEEKLDLYSNLKIHFDEIPGLKDVLIDWMRVNIAGTVDVKQKALYKEKLLSLGVHKDESILEFLLLIGEKQRIVEASSDVPSYKLGQLYFDAYKNSKEFWDANTFEFFRSRTSRGDRDKEKKAEETAIKLIVNSRASLAMALVENPSQAQEEIEKIDAQFTVAYREIFGKEAPIHLSRITRVTNEFTEHADRISRQTFVNKENLRDPLRFRHVVVHEAMHLCQAGISEKMLDEAITEYCTDKIFAHGTLAHLPLSELYQEWVNILNYFFAVIPGLEEQIILYVKDGNVSGLRDFMRGHFTNEVKEKINKNYIRGMEPFMNDIQKFIG